VKLFYALFCMTFGVYLIYKINKRKFNRTNQYGKEEFSSYGGKVTATYTEKFLRGVALVLIVLGGLLTL